MKHLLFIILFIFFLFSLFAQSDPELDLGNVIIQGQSSNLADSASYQRDFAFYNAVSDESEMGFKPHFQLPTVDEYIPETGDNLALQLLGGNSSARFDAALSMNDVLNFTAEYDYQSIEKDWENQMIDFHWLPKVKSYDLDLSFTDNTYNNSIDQTKISGYKFAICSPAFEVSTKFPLELKIAFSLAYQNFTQAQDEESDFNISSKVEAVSTDYQAQLNADYLKGAFLGYSNFGWKSIIFGNPALWLGYDELHIYPSISFDRSWQIYSGVSFRIANLPHISKQDCKDDFDDNSFQFLKVSEFQEKKQLNAFLAIHNDNLLPFTLYYNPQFIRDRTSFISPTSGYYSQQLDDRFIHNFGADICWKLDGFEIEHSVRLLSCDDDLYFEPLLKLKNIVSKQYGAFSGFAEVNFLADRTDDLGNEMDNYLQVNLNVEYRFKEYLSFFGYAENLLNTDHRRFNNVPEEKIKLYLGCRYTY